MQFWTNSGKTAGLSGKICLRERGLKGNQSVLRGAALKDSLITKGTSHGQIFPDNPLFVRLWGSKTKEDAADGLHEENPEGGFRLSLGAV